MRHRFRIRRALGSLTVIVLVLGAAGGWSSGPVVGQASSPGAVEWHTEVVDLAADGIRLDVGGDTFVVAGSPQGARSDAGGPESWTLEVDWQELGVAQRMNLYFRSDGTDWWVQELRTYDGTEEGHWIFYPGPLFRTPLGEPWTGDVRLEGVNEDPAAGARATGILTIDGLRLGVRPRSEAQLYAAPPGGGVVATIDPFEPGQPLHCSGILQLDPATAHRRILDAGYRVSWRSLHPTRPASPLVEPPVGTIESTALGSHGEVVVFVTDPAFGAAPQPTWDPACPNAPPPATPAPMDPAAFTGTIDGRNVLDEPAAEHGPVMSVQRGATFTTTIDATDPRIVGVLDGVATVHGFPTGRFMVEAIALSVTNDAGRWIGTATGTDANDTWDMTAVLTGEGSYRGLMAYLTVDWSTQTVRGVIAPGSMPEPPTAG